MLNFALSFLLPIVVMAASPAPTPQLPAKKDPSYQEKLSGQLNEGLNRIQNLNPSDFSLQSINPYNDPRFKKTIQFITSPKNFEALKVFANKSNLRKMVIGQILVILFMMLLKAWVNRRTKGFLSQFFNNIWIFGLHVFIALIVLPRYIYGAAFFDFVSQFAAIFLET